VKLNAGQFIPMRVKYPDAMMGEIAKAVRGRQMGAADRIGILSDHAALSKAGKLDPVRYLELLAAFDAEDDANVLGELIPRVVGLSKLLTAAPALHDAFLPFGRSLLMPAFARLGWDARSDDGHLTRKLRGELVSALPSLCASDAEVQAEARRRYDAYLVDKSPNKEEGKKLVPPEIAASVFKLVVSAGGEKEYEDMVSLFETLELNDDKKQALFGVGAASSPELRKRALDYALSGSVKLQDFFYVMRIMHGASPEGMAATWEHFVGKLDRYLEMLKTASASLMDACIGGACSGFASKEKLEEVSSFFASHEADFSKNQRTIKQTLEAMKTNTAYLDLIKASDALAWLQERNKAGAV
jgi:hypothetical protein